MATFSAELETLGKSGTVEGKAELVTRLEQEHQRVCRALATELDRQHESASNHNSLI